jgi:signal transduction histidine kinase
VIIDINGVLVFFCFAFAIITNGLGMTLSRDILAVTGIGISETGIPGKGARFEIHVPAKSWKRA